MQPAADTPGEFRESLIACHDCDSLYRKPNLREGEKARCARCGALLYQRKRDSLERSLSFTLTSLILFILANVYPLLSLNIAGRVEQGTIITGVKLLYAQGFWELALLVFVVSILMPVLKILGLLYILLPMRFNRRLWKATRVFRMVEMLHPWAMTEVYMLGILVAIVKLSDLASITVGTALYAFVALILFMAAADAALEPHEVWEQMEEATP